MNAAQRLPPANPAAAQLRISAEQLDMALGGQRYRLLINAVTDYAIFMLDPEG